MRISDWSSDVCSSDLHGDLGRARTTRIDQRCPRRHRQRRRRANGASVVQGLSRAVGRDYRGQMSIKITSAFDGGNIRVLSITDDTAELEIETDHQSRSEEHTSELQSLMRISYAVFCLKKKK